MKCLALATTLITFSASAIAQSPIFEERITLEITGDDQLASQLRSALRALPNVVVTDSVPRDIVKVVALTVGPKSSPRGIATAVAITSAGIEGRNFMMVEMLANCQCKDEKAASDLFGTTLADRVRFKGLSLFIGSLDLAEMARRIAAYVDQEAVEPARQEFQRAITRPQ